MAILISGATKCPICGTVIQKGDEVVAFPPFIPNELDPLHMFHDAAFHVECFRKHPLAKAAEQRYQELRDNSKFEHRIDAISGEFIDNPDDYLTLGHLTAEETHPLYPYNYMHLRCSQLSKWKDLEKVHRLIKELQDSGKWKGNALNWLLRILEDALHTRSQQ